MIRDLLRKLLGRDLERGTDLDLFIPELSQIDIEVRDLSEDNPIEISSIEGGFKLYISKSLAEHLKTGEKEHVEEDMKYILAYVATAIKQNTRENLVERVRELITKLFPITSQNNLEKLYSTAYEKLYSAGFERLYNLVANYVIHRELRRKGYQIPQHNPSDQCPLRRWKTLNTEKEIEELDKWIRNTIKEIAARTGDSPEKKKQIEKLTKLYTKLRTSLQENGTYEIYTNLLEILTILKQTREKQPHQILTPRKTPRKVQPRIYEVSYVSYVLKIIHSLRDIAKPIGTGIEGSPLGYTVRVVVRQPISNIDIIKKESCISRECETKTEKDVKMLKLPSRAEIVRRSWVIPHRKLGYDLPGRIKSIRTTLATAKVETEKTVTICKEVTYKPSRIISLIDTSGSTFYTLLPRFSIEESLAIAYALGINEIKIIEWDTEIRDVKDINRKLELGEILYMQIIGGGGTVIDPALEYVINIAQKGDLVLIFTDGGISITPNTYALAKMLRDRVCRIYMTARDIFEN
jgi:hypothetical protein